MKTLKLVSLALGLFCIGCGDNETLPDCQDVVEVKLCSDSSTAICTSSLPVAEGEKVVLQQATECIAWHRPIASQPLVPTLCSASCQ